MSRGPAEDEEREGQVSDPKGFPRRVFGLNGSKDNGNTRDAGVLRGGGLKCWETESLGFGNGPWVGAGRQGCLLTRYLGRGGVGQGMKA